MPREWGGGGWFFPRSLFSDIHSQYLNKENVNQFGPLYRILETRETQHISLCLFKSRQKDKGKIERNYGGAWGGVENAKINLWKIDFNHYIFFRELWQIKVIVKYSYILNKKNQVFKCCEHWTSYLSQFFVI